ncbi:hypothetical protein THASP1DRAFT_30399 [Thamnocephalis sphaerospora]|uniref:Uncharacterized protein n=1 Tax=Thamnocephalis sphaerospora TaxID=78915 RepID=A0A4P9XR60_9FUNG|nr:hypothetical protein THASP1DRAFT_30399 [Thamnocephalis sphaerospora]|eukprot:RKP07800.1 hypothetical protein THASP1DRAFT_30399 [Thamnocephalis sphaerospora]
MHPASLFHTALTIFAGLSLTGSLAGALSVPPIKASQLTPVMMRTTGMIGLRQTATSLSNIKAFLNERSNYHVQTVPYFAFYQPEGTQPVYRKDDKGRTAGIDFLDADKKAVRKLEVNWIADSDKIGNVAIRDLPFKSYPDTNVLTEFTSSNKGLQHYVIATARETTAVRARKAGDYTTMFIKVMPDRSSFALEKIMPWDGKSLPLAPGPKVAKA